MTAFRVECTGATIAPLSELPLSEGARPAPRAPVGFAYTRGVERAGEFVVAVETAPEGAVVAIVEGELDLATSPDLERALEQARPEGRLVIDLTACTFLDSSAIRVLAARAHSASGAGGSVAVVATHAGIRRVLEIAAIDTVIDLHETRESAL